MHLQIKVHNFDVGRNAYKFHLEGEKGSGNKEQGESGEDCEEERRNMVCAISIIDVDFSYPTAQDVEG
jgi:hypothetical protein